jgi:hypothetical protein
MTDEFYALDETWMMVDEKLKNYKLNKICHLKN